MYAQLMEKIENVTVKIENMTVKIEKRLGFWLNPILILSIISAAIYANSLQGAFTLDDFGSIANNYSIRNPLNFMGMWKFYSNRIVLYYSFSFNYMIHDTAVIGYHIVNILIHLLNGVLVYLLINCILKLEHFKDSIVAKYKNTISLLSALVFITHPVQTNAVTYIVQRTAALATTFYLLSTLFFILFRTNKKSRYYVFMLISIVFAMYTKENTFTIPFMLILLELMFFLKDRETSWLKRILFFLPVLLALVIIPVTNRYLGGFNASDPGNSIKASTSMDRMTYLLTEFNVLVTYLRLLILPVNQNFDYDYPLAKKFLEYPTVYNFAFLCIIIIFGLLHFRKNKLISLGILWFFIALSIESTVISIQDVIFEHRMYLAMPGYSMFLAGIVFYSYNKRKPVSFDNADTASVSKIIGEKSMLIFIFLCSVIIIFNSAFTVYRNYVFSDKIRLWEDVVKKSPNKSRPHSVLGADYMDTNKLDLAEKELKKALELSPYNYTALTNLGKVYLLMKNYDKSIEISKDACRKSPSVYTYNNLGTAYFKKGDLKDAVNTYLEGYRIDKKCTFILKGLADTYYEMKDYENASKYYNEFLQYNIYKAENDEVKGKLEKIKICRPYRR